MSFFEKFLGGNNKEESSLDSRDDQVVLNPNEGELETEVDPIKEIGRIEARIAELRSKEEFGPDDGEEVRKLNQKLEILKGE